MNIQAPFPLTKPEEVGLSGTGLERLSQAFQREIEARRVPGAVTLVARQGRIAHFEALGTRDPQTGAPMQRDTIFCIYSMTKPIVSVAVAILIEEGRLLVTDGLAQHLPEFADQTVASERDGRLVHAPLERPITIHDLLRHTSGLTYEITGMSPVQRMYVENRLSRGDWTNADHSAALARLPLFCQPGTEWNYSRSTDVLGRVVEVISGKSLGAFLAERIFKPLGMVDTAFIVPSEKRDRGAEPFPIDPDSGESVQLLPLRGRPAIESGGGGLWSTAADYARFAQMLAGRGGLGETRIIGRKTLDWMASDHLGPGIPIRGNLVPPGHGFGLGFAVRTSTGLSTSPGSIGQYFWGGYAGTSFFIDPAEDLYAVMLVQAPGRREYYRTLFRNLVYAAIEE